MRVTCHVNLQFNISSQLYTPLSGYLLLWGLNLVTCHKNGLKFFICSPVLQSKIKDEHLRTWASDLNKLWKQLARKVRSQLVGLTFTMYFLKSSNLINERNRVIKYFSKSSQMEPHSQCESKRKYLSHFYKQIPFRR